MATMARAGTGHSRTLEQLPIWNSGDLGLGSSLWLSQVYQQESDSEMEYSGLEPVAVGDAGITVVAQCAVPYHCF